PDRRPLHRLADPARLRVDRPPRGDLSAHPAAGRPRPPPHRRGAVQGPGPRAACGLRIRRARPRRTLHEGSPMSTPDRPDPDRPGPEDIDAEFARLTDGLGLDETPLTVDDVLTDGEDDQEPTLAVV